VAAGARVPQHGRDGIRKAFHKPGLGPALRSGPACWSWTDPDATVLQPQPPPAGAAAQRLHAAEAEIQRLRREIHALRASWTWRVGRLLTKPLHLFTRGR